MNSRTMAKRPRTIWISCLALLALQGCDAAFEASHPEGYLTYDANEDALRLVEIDAGLHATDDQQAARALAEFLSGRRIYPPEGGFLSYDLDALEAPAETPEAEDPSDRLVSRLAKLAKVHECGLYQGEHGELGFWRVTDLAPAGEVLAAIDQVLSEMVMRKLSDPARYGADEFVLWRDPESRELWLARARAGGPWVSIDGGRLLIDLPVSSVGAARALIEVVLKCEDEADRNLLAQIWRMEVVGGRARLWLGSAKSPMLHFGAGVSEEGVPPEVDTGLVQAVSDAGLAVGDAETIRLARERHGLPGIARSEGILELGPVAKHDSRGHDVVELKWWSDPEAPPLAVVAPLHRFRLKRAVACRDNAGYPGISIEFTPTDKAAFTAFTTRNVGQRVAIVAGGKIISAPNIMEPLQGSSILSGFFSEAVRDEILA
ncbi:MAG TPA: hypothetical protein VNB06_18905, partial [Thermoanaerobaculia bacterium]|nr:hypothetical protein [Thermoanaerobaculia bacterium]